MQNILSMKNILSIISTYLIYQLAFVVSQLYPHIPSIFWLAAIISFLFLIATWGGILAITQNPKEPPTKKENQGKFRLDGFSLVGLFALSCIPTIPVKSDWLSAEALNYRNNKAKQDLARIEAEKQEVRNQYSGKVVIQPLFDLTYSLQKVQWPITGVPGLPPTVIAKHALSFDNHSLCQNFLNNSFRHINANAYCTEDILK